MVKLDYSKWGDSPELLRKRAQDSSHARSRERFLALYEISQGQSATEVAQKSGRDSQTVMRWVRKYNICGPEQLNYQRSGGRPSLLKK